METTELKENNPKKVFSTLGIGLFAMTIIVNVVQFILAKLIYQFIPDFMDSSWYTYVLVIVSFYLIGAPCFYLIVKKLPKAEIKEKKMLHPLQFLGFLVASYAAMYIFNIIGVIINYVLGLITGNMNLNPLNSVIGGLDLFPTIVVACICAPIVEEIVFRKILLDRVRAYGDMTAILVSGLCFGLYHGNIAQFLYATALGSIFAYVVIKTGNIKNSILMHICVNLLGAAILPQLVKMGTIATMLAGLFVMAVVLIGIVVVIVTFAMKKITFEKGEIVLEHPVKSVWGNLGMILFILISLASFVLVVVGM